MNQFLCHNCDGDHETKDCPYHEITKKYIIKKQSGFSFMYFSGFDKHEAEPSWTGHWTEAEKFNTYGDALKLLATQHEYDYRVFHGANYQIEPILIKG
jgi:hypothetical protein